MLWKRQTTRTLSRRNRKPHFHLSIRKAEFLVRYLSTKKSPNPDELTGESCQTFKEVVMLLLYKLFLKTDVGALSKSFCEAVNHDMKTRQNHHNKTNPCTNSLHNYRHKIVNKILAASKNKPKMKRHCDCTGHAILVTTILQRQPQTMHKWMYMAVFQ